jgi:oligopeptidase A
VMALFDLDLHASPDDGQSLQQRLDAARELCGYWPLEDFENPAHAFDYLVDHYDAGYYAYVWSDVHAFDLFSRFRTNGLLDRATGRALQEELLAHGSARPLLTSIEAFLGRPVDLGPYLHWHGLA